MIDSRFFFCPLIILLKIECFYYLSTYTLPSFETTVHNKKAEYLKDNELLLVKLFCFYETTQHATTKN